MAVAIVTGGSSGLGLEFAEQLAGRGMDLILIAREGDRLDQVSERISKNYGVHVEPIEADLSDRSTVEKLVKLTADQEDLAYFVNNAGFATHLSADDHSPQAQELQRAAVDVMATNVLLFSTAAASAMKRRGKGRIINISSTASWTFQGNYSAIKSYVLTYTTGLGISLEGTGVTATAVCPAWLHTNFHKSAGLGEPAIPEWLYMNPTKVAKKAIAGALRGRRVVIPNRRWAFIIWVLAHGPVALRRHISRAYMRSSNYSHDKKQ